MEAVLWAGVFGAPVTCALLRIVCAVVLGTTSVLLSTSSTFDILVPSTAIKPDKMQQVHETLCNLRVLFA